MLSYECGVSTKIFTSTYRDLACPLYPLFPASGRGLPNICWMLINPHEFAVYWAEKAHNEGRMLATETRKLSIYPRGDATKLEFIYKKMVYLFVHV